MSVLIDYAKKCGLVNSIFFLVFLLFSTGTLAASSLWLSAWSNEDAEVQSKTKIFRLTIYVVLGLSQCKFLLFEIQRVFIFINSYKLLKESFL